MDAQSFDDPEAVIRLGGPMPVFIRWMLIGAGVFASVMVVVELGRGLWPLSVLSLFFGFIIAGGLSVGLAFVVFGVWSPDEQWEIRPGCFTLTVTRGRHRLQRHFTPDDFEDLTVVRDDSGDGPDTWHLLARIRLDSPNLILPQQEAVFAGLRWLERFSAPMRGWHTRPVFHDRLRSPSLTTEAAAHKALACFLSESKRLQ
ncbi:hypothetical protein [Asticcacaulis sp.]|uniref:hypothetical protein n=1 Tax=Asticcacaulis sp. TaxID=1872648 RepID=UPI00263024EE|nr:hypothetical protein [Asticcacaulis sp.]